MMIKMMLMILILIISAAWRAHTGRCGADLTHVVAGLERISIWIEIFFLFLFWNENIKNAVAALRRGIQSSCAIKSKYKQKQTRLETEIVAAGVICTRLNTTRLWDSTKKFMNIWQISIQIVSIFDKTPSPIPYFDVLGSRHITKNYCS